MLRDNLNTLDEKRYMALIHMENYQQQTRKYYDGNVKYRTVQVGDFALCRAGVNLREKDPFAKNWEGPYFGHAPTFTLRKTPL